MCLRIGHRNDQCQQNKSCRRCQGNHHQSICERPFQPVGSTPPVHTNSNLAGESRSTNEERTELNDKDSSSASVSHTTTTSAKGPYKVLLQTAATYAKGFNDSSPVPVRILLDSGSQRSYVTTALKERLKLAPLKTETLNLNTFGDDRFTKQRCDLVKLSLHGKEDTVEISALCFPKICSPLSASLDVSRYPHLQGLDFADASIVDGSQPNIDILIGSDFYFEVLTGEVVRGDSGPVAVNSKFGWVASGPTLERGEKSDTSMANLVIEKIGSQNPYPDNENDSELSRALRKFWDIESLGIQDKVDRTRDSEFLSDIRFEETEGRYEIQLPWKNSCAPKSDGYMMCSRRLFQLHSRLKKDEPLLREYEQTIRQQIESKIVQECEESQDPEDCSHFLPHHGVIKQDRQMTKLRVVFDGSAKSTSDDLSLNDCLQKGPNLVPHLFDTVIKFRGYPIGIIADIEKAFHQIQIAPDDRRMLKFLWLDNIEKGTPEVKQYQFRRLPFGLTPSPAILASTIRYHLSKYEESELKIVSLLRDSFYVDDFAGGAYEDSEALQIYRTSKELMNKGGFQLRKWNSNSKPVRESIKVQEGSPANEMNQIKQEVDYCDSDGIMQVNADTSNEKDSVTSPSQPPSVESDEDCFVKFLGINWNVNTDEFRYDLTELMSYANSLPDIKRSVLKLAAKVFDPMGLLTPFTINMKIFFQSLCIKGVDWEDKLDGKALTRWRSLVADL